jgi:hypothetical protein
VRKKDNAMPILERYKNCETNPINPSCSKEPFGSNSVNHVFETAVTKHVKQQE